jgi:hypothetical protein
LGGKHPVVDTVRDAGEASRLLSEGYRVGADPATESIGKSARTEDELRGEGKWETVRTGGHTYRDAEVKVYRPRLEISHLARESGVLVNDSPDLDWALLVTLRAEQGVDLYDRVRAQYRVLTSLPTPTVSVRTATP